MSLVTRGLGAANLVTRGFGAISGLIRYVMRAASISRELVDVSTAPAFRGVSTAAVSTSTSTEGLLAKGSVALMGSGETNAADQIADTLLTDPRVSTAEGVGAGASVAETTEGDTKSGSMQRSTTEPAERAT